MTPGIRERELAIGRLRNLTEGGEVNWPSLMLALGATSRKGAVERICDLADTAAWANTVRDNGALIERCRGLEAENARLKSAVAMSGTERVPYKSLTNY